MKVSEFYEILNDIIKEYGDSEIIFSSSRHTYTNNDIKISENNINVPLIKES